MGTSLNSKGESKKVLAIALDAAEPDLIEKWMDEGHLTNLAALRAKGTFGKLSSSADWLAGAPWPTFSTGTLPDEHGFYHYLQWRSDKMDYERPNPNWISMVPFWRKFGSNYRVISVDMPLAFPPDPFNGIEISGWASHDRIFPPFSYPENKIKWVLDKFGKPPISNEVGGLQEINELLKVKEELIQAVKKESDLATTLIKEEEWDLFLCCFTATHRGGHKFWDETNIKGEFTEEQKVKFNNSLREIYKSCDDAIGEIVKNSGGNVSILVFSLHGMGENTTLADKILPSMISNIMSNGDPNNKNDSTNFIKKMRGLIPLEIRSNLRKFLPVKLQDKMTAYWRSGGTDWSTTKVINLLADLQGYIRINLKGREKEGIVEAKEYDELCKRLIEGLKSFKDEKTNEPVIESVKRKDQLYNEGKGFDNLPDILIKWKFKPSAGYTKIVSSEYGEIKWPLPGKNPDGRSGNHRPDGFLLAAGEKFQPDTTFKEKHHIVDLAPTILHLLNIEKPGTMQGKSILQ